MSEATKIEQVGLQQVPPELKTTTFWQYVSMQTAINVNAGNVLVPALAVLAGLSVIEAVIVTWLGAVTAYSLVALLSLPGAQHGIPAQYAIRGYIGVNGARFFASPLRAVTSVYWFAVQAIGGALFIQALLERWTGWQLPFYAVVLPLAFMMALLAVIGFQAIRSWTVKSVPFMLAGIAIMLYYLVRDLPSVTSHTAGWTERLLFFSLAFMQYSTGVTSAADLARYAKSVKQGVSGMLLGNALGFFLTALLGALTAAQSGQTNPFIFTVEQSNSSLVIGIILLYSMTSMISINVMNAYNGSFSLLNAWPKLKQWQSTTLFSTVAISVALFPTFVTEAKQWITYLSIMTTPLSAVIVADFLAVKRLTFPLASLTNRWNVPAFIAIGSGALLHLIGLGWSAVGSVTFVATTLIYLVGKKVSKR